MPPVELRPYQERAIERITAAWADGRHPMFVGGTGIGKTILGLAAANALLPRDGDDYVLWIAHTDTLLTQPLADLRRHWPHRRGGIVKAARNQYASGQDFIFASVQTLDRPERLQAILDERGPPLLLVVDEAHRSMSDQYQRVIEHAQARHRLGLTATPDRMDGRPLSDLWEIVDQYAHTDAVRDGWNVSPYAVVATVPGLDPRELEGLDDDEQGELLIRQHIVEHTVAAMEATHTAERLPLRDSSAPMSVRGRPALVFCASCEQARLTNDALLEAGWRSRLVTGATSERDRARLIKALQAGKLDVLVTVQVLAEGTDITRVSAVVLARAFDSWSLFCQAVGRAVRLYHPAGGKGWNAHDAGYTAAAGAKVDAFVLDLAGATRRHSLIGAAVLLEDDAPACEHEWREKKGGGGVCELCEARVACLPRLGAHDFDAEGVCTACEAPQCPESPTNRHLPVPMADDPTRRECCFCGVTFSDALVSLLRRREGGAPEGPPKDAFLHVEPGRVWALDVASRGLLFTVRTESEALDLHWLPKGARNLRTVGLSVSPEEARLLTADLCRKAARFVADRRPVRPGTIKYAEKARSAVDVAALGSEGEARRALATEYARRRWESVRGQREAA